MDNKYDAIVVGTGISGGWAAKELCEKGLRTLVLERGPMIKHVEDYSNMFNDHWDYPHGDVITNEIRKNQPKQSRTGYVNKESTKHLFVDDNLHPYNETKPFDWIRGYHVGGRSLTWGRQVYRLSDFDFNGVKLHFDYETYLIDLIEIDTLRMMTKNNSKDSYNYLFNIGGDLFINHPKNKSSRRDLPKFPSFISKKSTKVYFINNNYIYYMSINSCHGSIVNIPDARLNNKKDKFIDHNMRTNLNSEKIIYKEDNPIKASYGRFYNKKFKSKSCAMSYEYKLKKDRKKRKEILDNQI